MYGEFFLLEGDDGETRKATRVPLGETRGRNEAWPRDTLYANPELIPIDDLEPAYGPLLPLCTELRTEAGPIDIAFINPLGKLTLVECKLWRNAEARRKVVAQVLDYARAIKSWSYADLQRQTSIATGRRGNPIVQQPLLAAGQHLFALFLGQSQPIGDLVGGNRHPRFAFSRYFEDRQHQSLVVGNGHPKLLAG